MRGTWIAILLISVVLAGCSDPPVKEVEDPTFEEFSTDVKADKGLIRGVVVDQTVAPIADATVTLLGTEFVATTNADGAFQFADLDPGTYFMEVKRTGFEPTQTSATVVAGVVPGVTRIQLMADPESIPTAVTLQSDGHTGCSFLFGITSLRWACDDVDPPVQARFHIDSESAPDALQAEMHWKATQLAGDQMRMFVRNGNGPDQTINANYIGLISGPSPLTCLTLLGQSCSDDTGLSNDTWTGWVHVDGAAGCINGCVPTPIGGAGLGMMVDQDYEVFLTVFTKVVPREGWTYIADGAYVIDE